MPSVIFIDGVETPPAQAAVSVFDRGFLYGDTVFETLRVYGSRPHLLPDHLARLRASAHAVGIAIAERDEALAAEIIAAISASTEREAVVRVTLSRGEGPLGIDPRSAVRPRRFVHVEPLSTRLASPDAVVSVRLVATRRGADLAPAAKIGAYVDGILALRFAQAAGDDDALLVDGEGALLEATTSNVFVVMASGSVVTPPLGAIFPGLARREVLEIAARLGIHASETIVTRAELLGAREAFLTSSIREVTPIARVDGAPLGTGDAGPVTRAFRDAYRAAVATGL
jgi:branched-chain amino acid aminotransferase